MKNRYIVSWSGGKDCLLAMYMTMGKWGNPVTLLSSIPQNADETLAHGYRDNILAQQAEAMQLPIEFMFFEDGNYRPTYIKTLSRLKASQGITHVVFGDIYLNEHRDWLVDVCREVALEPVFPLWCQPHQASDLLRQYLDWGFQSIIVHARHPYPGKEWLGKTLTHEFGQFAEGRFCPMGENGEFHTLAIDGPCFKTPLQPVLGAIRSTEKGDTLTVLALEPVTINQ